MKRYQDITKKLISADLKANKLRNAFIILAVFLTTFLLSATLNIGVNFFENMRMEQFRQYGTMTNGAVGNPTEQQIEQLEQLEYITVVSRMINVVEAVPVNQAENIKVELWYADDREWSVMRAPVYTDINGKYPQNENELMLNMRTLRKLGISDPTIGMEIPLVPIGLTQWDKNKTFYLSGWYTDYQAKGAAHNIESVYASEALCRKLGRTMEKNGVAYFLVADSSKISTYIKSLKTDLQPLENQPITASQMFSDDGSKVNSIIFFALLVVIFILSGYLIINNVLYISLRRDIQYYGSLKSLGTTQKQIYIIVFGQIVRLCLVGIIAGLVLTFILSSVFLPTIISMLRNTDSSSITSSYPQLIYPLAAVFAFATTLLGAFRPVKKIASISPVEALRFVESSGRKNKSSTKRTGGNLFRMALRNVFRERKRTLMVISSLFLGITIFLVIQTAVLSMGTENSIQNMMESDIVLTGHLSSISGWGVSSKFDDKLMTAINDFSGIESISVMTCASALVSNRDFFNRTVPLPDEDIPNWIYGVPKEDIIRLNQEHSLRIDVDAFECGEFAAIASDDMELASAINELLIKPIPIGSDEGDETQEYVKLPVGAWVPESFKNKDGGSMMHPAIFISNSYMEKIYNASTIQKVYINVSREEEANIVSSIKQIIQGDSDITFTSRSDIREMFQGIQFILNVVGGTIAGIICLIGLLNFANVILVGILARKSEFATLESIGMSVKQIQKLLMLEGLCYAVISLFFVFTVGNILGFATVELLKATITSAIYVNPVLPMVCISVLILAICMFLPLALYRSLSKSSIAKRIRENM